MSTSLANKTTISSRSKVATTNYHQINGFSKSNIQPPGTYASSKSNGNHNTNAFKTPAPSAAGSRLANLANGLPTVARNSTASAIARSTDGRLSASAIATATKTNISRPESKTTFNEGSRPMVNYVGPSQGARTVARPATSNSTGTSLVTRFPPSTSIKVVQHNKINLTAPKTTSRAIGINRNRLASASNNNNILRGHIGNSGSITQSNHLNSRSPSIVSSIDSSIAGSKRPSVASSSTTVKNPAARIPDTNVIRKGLAKFSNPIECQRQFLLLNERIKQLTDDVQSKDQEVERLQAQLDQTLKSGTGYAIIVQYFAKKLKLDSKLTLESECFQLESRVRELEARELEYETKLESIVSDYKSHLKVELDLRDKIKLELDEARLSHRNELNEINEAHTNELNNLATKHSETVKELELRIETLESDLKTKTKEATDIRQSYENLSASYNKLEESLTKDKDARVKYAQEKVSQLQKDVESLNSVLEMRLERIHALEKDSLLLSEIRNDLSVSQDSNKALRQQMESLQAALDKKRKQFENLVAEHEKLGQELKRERRERRRMTMKTEELEYVLNESCATENNLAFHDTSISECDHSGSDILVSNLSMNHD